MILGKNLKFLSCLLSFEKGLDMYRIYIYLDMYRIYIYFIKKEGFLNYKNAIFR